MYRNISLWLTRSNDLDLVPAIPTMIEHVEKNLVGEAELYIDLFIHLSKYLNISL